jgi:RHS repeat-associated protein
VRFNHLPSVRAMFDASGGRIPPLREARDWTDQPAPAGETKGWIGKRYDAGAGLQYLNARYYDPELGMFIQPDWFEVTKPGVRTNRYSYSFNDPLNLRDPGGNFTGAEEGAAIIIGALVVTSVWVAEKTSDYVNDWKMNSNGLLARSTKGIIDFVVDSVSNDTRIFTPERAKHILDEHRGGQALPGKTEFPEDWTETDIIDGVEEAYWGESKI